MSETTEQAVLTDDMPELHSDGMDLEKAQEFVKDLRKSEAISLRTLVDRVGYSAGAWSSYFKGTYKGNTENMDIALIRFAREWKTTSSMVPISGFKRIQKVCSMAQQTRRLAVLYGPAGIGKTVACEHYAQNHKGVIYQKIIMGMRPGELLSEVVKKVGESYSAYTSTYSRILAIQNALRKQSRLIIIDEADQLSVRTLEMIRGILDDGCVGIALIGLPRIMTLLTTGYTRKDNLAQLYSRADYRWPIEPPSEKEVKLIIDRYGFDISPGMKRQIVEWSRGAGELRFIQRLMERTADVAEWSSRQPDDAAVKGAYKLLIGGIDAQ